jgi:hypothetical protein
VRKPYLCSNQEHSIEIRVKMAKFFFYSLILILIPCVSVSVSAQPYYVSPSGSDSNTGTISSPFLTIGKAVTMVSAGQTIYVRGGTYNLTSTITISKSGTADKYINLFAYQNERPVLNFSAQAFGSRGIQLSGSYWHIKGIDVTLAGDNGLNIAGGNYNVIEYCSFYRNKDSGLQLDSGSAYDTILNCDSYFNADPTDYGDADGFAVKMAVGTGNYFYGCRSWRNCDDGWDGYLRGTDDVSTTVVNCWSFENGYFEEGTDAGVNANGNGFKMGGSDDKTLKHNFTLKQCLAFNNKAKGFDQNNNKGSMTLYNCSGYSNLTANYRITQTLADGKTLIVKNCLDLDRDPEIGSFAIQQTNSWLSPFNITSDDFINIVPTGVTALRKSDGSLPDITYMHLMTGSDLIDAGVNVGLPYAGSAPDLGCFETSMTGVDDVYTATEAECYPNPVKSTLIFHLALIRGGHCTVILSDVSGRFVKMIVDENMDPGENYRTIDLSELKNGLFLYRVDLNDVRIASGKIMKLGE